jgi:CheY-like chemotaxis protein/anti-sigma regulatory factor (Ser/Thr protein kinase)
LASIIHQAVETVRPLIERAAHRIEINLPRQPIYLDADPVRLAQVFSNLLNNACKFMDSPGQITVTVLQQDNEVSVSIKDTGVGIAEGKQESIFEMFTQANTTLTRSVGGLGIGLTLAKRLVELHGGRIGVYSEGIGHGSEFVIHLPILAATTQQTKVSTPVIDWEDLTLRILIVDDNRDGADTLAQLLQFDGHEIHTAYDGLAAVKAAEQFRPNLILLDIGLPNLNGYDVCRQIRAQTWGKNIRIVALTGWGQDKDRRKSEDAGFDDLLVKPVDYATLSQLLTSLFTTDTATA